MWVDWEEPLVFHPPTHPPTHPHLQEREGGELWVDRERAFVLLPVGVRAGGDG